MVLSINTHNSFSAGCSQSLHSTVPASGTAITQAQDLELCFVKLHEVHVGPAVKYVQVPVDDIPSLLCDCITQLSVQLANLLREHSMPGLCDCSKAEALLRERGCGRPECTNIRANAEHSCSARTGRPGGPWT